jgi:hypothetical protein
MHPCHCYPFQQQCYWRRLTKTYEVFLVHDEAAPGVNQAHDPEISLSSLEPRAASYDTASQAFYLVCWGDPASFEEPEVHLALPRSIHQLPLVILAASYDTASQAT